MRNGTNQKRQGVGGGINRKRKIQTKPLVKKTWRKMKEGYCHTRGVFADKISLLFAQRLARELFYFYNFKELIFV